MWTQNFAIRTSLVSTDAAANMKARQAGSRIQASLLAVYALGLSSPSSIPYSVTDGAMPVLIGLMHALESKHTQPLFTVNKLYGFLDLDLMCRDRVIRARCSN